MIKGKGFGAFKVTLNFQDCVTDNKPGVRNLWPICLFPPPHLLRLSFSYLPEIPTMVTLSLLVRGHMHNTSECLC